MSIDKLREQAAYTRSEQTIIESHPIVDGVLRNLRADRPNTARAVIDTLRPIFLDTSWIISLSKRWMGQLVEGSAAGSPVLGPLGDNGMHPIRHGVMLKTPFAHVSIQAFDSAAVNRVRTQTPSSTVELGGRTTIMRVINGGMLQADMFEYDALSFDCDVEAPRLPISRRSEVIDAASGLIETCGRHQAMRITASDGDPLALTATIFPESLPFRLLYDINSGKLVRSASNDEADNVSRMLMSALRVLEDEDRAKALCDFLDHPTYFVRWNSLRELVIAQGVAAMPAIERRLELETNPCLRRGLARLSDYVASIDHR